MQVDQLDLGRLRDMLTYSIAARQCSCSRDKHPMGGNGMGEPEGAQPLREKASSAAPLTPINVFATSGPRYGEKVGNMVEGLSQEAFLSDPKTFFAVCYCIQVIGEAAWKLSEGFKTAVTDIPWPLIAGMRHRLVHDYGRTDETIVHQVATVHLPELLKHVRAILVRHGQSVTF